MRQRRFERVWIECEDSKEYILWAGIFGSVARGLTHEESDVDVIVVMKEDKRSGEPVHLHEGEH